MEKLPSLPPDTTTLPFLYCKPGCGMESPVSSSTTTPRIVCASIANENINSNNTNAFLISLTYILF